MYVKVFIFSYIYYLYLYFLKEWFTLTKTFADDLLTPCYPICPCLSFFLFDENIPGFFSIMHFSGNQTVQGPKDTFSTNCKLFKGL